MSYNFCFCLGRLYTSAPIVLFVKKLQTTPEYFRPVCVNLHDARHSRLLLCHPRAFLRGSEKHAQCMGVGDPTDSVFMFVIY
jgi:hypothetical protein